MATKIRLQRHGRKKRAFYHIVVADSRAPRDGRFIEKIGTYNPITNPATIELDLNKATDWLLKGAQPTDTAAAILSYKGAKFKKHLQVGVNKGAITQEDADKKFAEWLSQKEGKVLSKIENLTQAKNDARSAAFKAEQAKKDAIAAKIQDRLAAEAAANNPVVEEHAEEVPASEEVVATEEPTPTEPAAETPAEPTAE
jgi:small subunit ribosomal protein S16